MTDLPRARGATAPGRPVVAGREVVVAPTRSALAELAVQRVGAVLGAAARDRGAAHLVLTGGSMGSAFATALLGALDSPDDALHGLDLTRLHLWWGDERFVPADDADRNDRQLTDVLSRLEPAGATAHRMPARDRAAGDDDEAGGVALAEAARVHEAEIRRLISAGALRASGSGQPVFDVVLLGVGPDTHVASLFPGHPASVMTTRTVIAVDDSPKPPPQRTSLSLEAIRAAEHVWLLAAGDDKADAVRVAAAHVTGQLRREDGTLRCPAAAAAGRNTVWWLDETAARGLM